MTSWARFNDGIWTLKIYVQPGARVSEIAGEHDGRLKIRISAPPAENSANKALIGFIANLADVPRSSVKLMHGHTNRKKTVLVESDEERLLVKILG
jgi:uncharacterized protein (TIGR00251 family)